MAIISWYYTVLNDVYRKMVPASKPLRPWPQCVHQVACACTLKKDQKKGRLMHQKERHWFADMYLLPCTILDTIYQKVHWRLTSSRVVLTIGLRLLVQDLANRLKKKRMLSSLILNSTLFKVMVAPWWARVSSFDHNTPPLAHLTWIYHAEMTEAFSKENNIILPKNCNC